MNFVKENLLVVKVGTNTLADVDGGRLNEEAFRRIGGEVRNLTDEKTGVVLVSSGAITAGAMLDCQRCDEETEMVERQRYALRGWDEIIQRWKAAIGADRVSAALLTEQDLRREETRTKALGVIGCALAHGDVPILNENDAVCVEQIRFGDNDTLAANLAAELAISGMFRAVRLILLTNVDGLLKKENDASTIIREVTDIESVRQFAGDTKSKASRGGMKFKVNAAEIATSFGVETFIANGRDEQDAVSRAVAAEIGTRFAPLSFRT